jgi:hypothetical protein
MGVKGHPCVQLFSQESTSWKRTSNGDDVMRSLHEMVLKLDENSWYIHFVFYIS